MGRFHTKNVSLAAGIVLLTKQFPQFIFKPEEVPAFDFDDPDGKLKEIEKRFYDNKISLDLLQVSRTTTSLIRAMRSAEETTKAADEKVGVSNE
jgi:hypothetical protein